MDRLIHWILGKLILKSWKQRNPILELDDENPVLETKRYKM